MHVRFSFLASVFHDLVTHLRPLATHGANGTGGDVGSSWAHLSVSGSSLV